MARLTRKRAKRGSSERMGQLHRGRKHRVNIREQNIVSALNIVGTSIERAANMTSIATREEFRNHKSNRKLLSYAWVDKEQRLDKRWTKLFNASDLPWKEFGDY